MRRLALLFVLLASPAWAQQYPPEKEPIQPSVALLWMTLHAPALDLPAAPPGQPVKVLRLGPSNVFSSQASFTTFCNQLDANNITVYRNAWATEPAGSVPTLVQTVGCLWLPDYVSPNNMDTELDAIKISMGTLPPPPGYTTIPGLTAQLRAQYHADMVALYNNDGRYCGLAYIGAAVYGSQWSFRVVQKGCADGNYSDVHEAGHNFGMQHDDPNASGGTPSQPWGFGFCPGAIDKTRRDPMVYPSPCGGNRVPFFGNPQDTHFGYPFGDATHDGAKLHRWAMRIVANFYPPLPVAVPAVPGKPTVH